jgi:hypothetical protein
MVSRLVRRARPTKPFRAVASCSPAGCPSDFANDFQVTASIISSRRLSGWPHSRGRRVNPVERAIERKYSSGWGRIPRRTTLEKKIAGIVGAVAALGTIGSVQAAPAPNPTDVLQVSSYADLLQPVQNAGAFLQALDEQQSSGSMQPSIRLAQNHHHHHDHSYARRPHIVVAPHRRDHYHHHHHDHDHDHH